NCYARELEDSCYASSAPRKLGSRRVKRANCLDQHLYLPPPKCSRCGMRVHHGALIGLTCGSLDWDETAGDFAPVDDLPLPPAVRKRFAHEPKWVDLRAYREAADKRDAKFTELAADFAAAI